MNNNNKVFSMKNMVIIEIFILYVVLRIGDAITSASNLSRVITRFIPIGIVSAVSTYFLITLSAQRSFRHERESFLLKIKVIPIIIAIILLVYGLISVKQNLSNVEDKISTYKSLYSYATKNSSTEIDNLVKEAKNKAIMSWIITSIVYLAIAEGTTFFVKNTVDDLFIVEEPSQIN